MNNATLLSAGALFTNAPEEAYAATVPESHRKALGQFFTPAPLAEFMARWITANPQCRTILDPAAGLGVFFRAVEKIKPHHNFQFVGYDVDAGVLQQAARLCQAQLKNEDFLFNGWQAKYDGIICNPPYFKFQDYGNRHAGLRELQDQLGLNLSGFTNIYTMFLLKSLSHLAAQGRAAFLVPFEFLNADYGTLIKKHLLASGTLRYVILFSPRETIFPDALTTSCLLLCANDQHQERVTFIDAQSQDNLGALAEGLANYPKVCVPGRTFLQTELNPAVKWRNYYQKPSGKKFRNLVPFATYGKVVRGIATGDNDYFTFDEKKKTAWQIPDEFLLPCLTKAPQVKSNFFTASDFAKLRDTGQRVYVLDAGCARHPSVQRYLAEGERLGTDKRYLTSHRNPWHALEHRPPAPLLVTVFNRHGLRFVHNEAMARNLTCFHAIYLNLLAQTRSEVLFAYVLTDIAKEIFDANRREYGGGLNKFEPNDLNNSAIIDLDVISVAQQQAIVAAHDRYRESVCNDAPDTTPLAELNQLFSAIVTV